MVIEFADGFVQIGLQRHHLGINCIREVASAGRPPNAVFSAFDDSIETKLEAHRCFYCGRSDASSDWRLRTASNSDSTEGRSMGVRLT